MTLDKVFQQINNIQYMGDNSHKCSSNIRMFDKTSSFMFPIELNYVHPPSVFVIGHFPTLCAERRCDWSS